MNFSQMQHFQDILLKSLEEIQSQLKNLPKGKILCIKNGKYTKWFKSNHSKPIYIKKKNRKLAIGLAKRTYLTALSSELSAKLELVNSYIDGYNKIIPKSELLLRDPSFRDLILPLSNMNSEYIKSWSTDNYRQNPNYPEQLSHKCMSGEYVRSKSEVIIANALYLSGIPYRYECPLEIDDMTFYPDFTILNPITLKIYYWEHFGMMDNMQYIDKTFNKLKQLSYNQIIPSINLITTYETKNIPLDSEQVNQIINYYFS